MADDQKLTLTVQVNADTGQLEVLGSKMKQTGESASNAFKSFLPAVTAGAILAFFTSAIKGAEEQNQAMQRLKFTLESTGQAWDKHAGQIDEWGKAIARTTRFSDTEALITLDKLARATGNVTTAQSASTLAMGLAVRTGKDLGETTEFVNNLINKNERAVMMAHREYGTFVGQARNAQEILDTLQKKIGQSAFQEDNLTSNTHKLSSSFGQFKDVIGNAFAPAANAIVQMLTKLVQGFETLGTVIAANVLSMIKTFQSLGEAINRAFHLDFAGAKAALQNIARENAAIGEALTQQLSEQEHKKTDIAIAGAQARIRVTEFETDAEKTKREELAKKIEELEAESAAKIAALGQDTLKKKQQMLNQEIAARSAKINREISDERAKTKLLEKLDMEKFQRSAQLVKLEQQVKLAAALETVDVSLQTLSVLNSMSSQNTEAEVNRAKAILALEKAIAIARILSSPQAAINPGLAAAQIALTVAQFGQQFQAIDQAHAAFKSGQSQTAISTDLGNGQTITDISGPSAGGGGFALPGGAGGGGGALSSSGGGGGAGTVINLGGMSVNIDIAEISGDNIDAVMRKIYEKVRQGTVEGIQLSVAVQNLATKNSKLAT